MPVARNNNVSVVILTRNSASTIDQCLKSIIQEHPGEIIAVDNMSTDGTLQILRRYGVKVVTDATYSLGEARQVGVNSATREYLMFVDSDIELTKNCIRQLVNELEAKGWVAVQARTLSKENISYWQNRGYSPDGALLGSRVGPQRSIATAATVFRREMLLDYPFDPHFVDAAEDIDICLRLGGGGHVVGKSTTTAVYHAYRREFLALFRQQVRYGRGYSRLAYKYGSMKLGLQPIHYVTSYLMKAVITGKWNRIPYHASVLTAIIIGMITFQPGKEWSASSPYRRPNHFRMCAHKEMR